MPISLNKLKSKISSDNSYLVPMHSEEKNHNMQDIAVIGYECRFGFADNKEEFWELLRRGLDGIVPFPEQRKKYGEEFLKYQDKYGKYSGFYEGGFLNDVDKFDNERFPINKLEISLMSPEQRLFLTTAWNALEDAGYGGRKSIGKDVGVFIGNSVDFGVPYRDFIHAQNPDMSSVALSGNLNGIIASRISFLNDWKGPAIDVDTACSSALAAIHMACKSLREGECKIALAGAVKVDNLPLNEIKQAEDALGITSSDGRTKTFDVLSDGTGLGEGVGVIVLKKLSQAQQDHDHICAVIKGSALNHDGKSANLTAPNPAAQEAVIMKAWKNANIKPDTISYIEAHGTGTKLGDPIEIKGITGAFRNFTDKEHFCGIGSVKSNIGHLDHASGMAGIIKLLLCLEHKKLVPSVHFTKPNEAIHLEDAPVYVNTEYKDWKPEGAVRRCGISAFGLSGTNAHIILEEAGEPQKGEVVQNKYHILTLSATNDRKLLEYIWSYGKYLYQESDVDLEDLCYTANTGRESYQCRIAYVFETIDELKNQMELSMIYPFHEMNVDGVYYNTYHIISEEQTTKEEHDITTKEKSNRTSDAIALLQKGITSKEDFLSLASLYCSGADVSWEEMYGKKGCTNYTLSLPVYPAMKKSFWVETKVAKESETKREQTIEHPLLHYLAVDNDDTTIYESRWSGQEGWNLSEGIVFEMVSTAVHMNYEVQTLKFEDVVFENKLSLLKSESATVQTIVKQQENCLCFRIVCNKGDTSDWITLAVGNVFIDKAFGTEQYSIKDIEDRCKEKTLSVKDKEMIHTITGSKTRVDKLMVGENELLAHITLAENGREMNFSDSINPSLFDVSLQLWQKEMKEDTVCSSACETVFLSKSIPEQTWCYIKMVSTEKKEEFVADIMFLDDNGSVQLAATNYVIKKSSTTSFQDKNYYYKHQWKPASDPNWNEDASKPNEKDFYVILDHNFHEGEPSNKARQLREMLKKSTVISVNDVTEEKLSEILSKGHEYEKIVMIQLLREEEWNLSYTDEQEKWYEKEVSLLRTIMKMISAMSRKTTYQLINVSNSAYAVTDKNKKEDSFAVSYHTLCLASATEVPNLQVKVVDCEKEQEVQMILGEMETNDSKIAAYRNGERFIPILEEYAFEEQNADFLPKENDVFLITGGTGGIGLQITKWLTEQANVKVALIGRRAFPEREQWDQILKENTDTKLVSKIIAVREMEQKGSRIYFYSANVSSDSVIDTYEQIEQEIGQVTGIIHAAGIAGDGFLLNKSMEQIEATIAPKMKGSIRLAEFAKQKNVKFVLMCSSISSLLLDAGQSDYSAANRFMDSLCINLREEGIAAYSINWPAWKETGMAVDYQVDLSHELFSPVMNDQTKAILYDLFTHKPQNVTAGKLDYQVYVSRKDCVLFELGEQTKTSCLYAKKKKRNSETIVTENKGIKLLGDTSYSKTLTEIATIIGNVLDIEELNVYQSFMELGGNSIVAIKVIVELEAHGFEIALSDLYADCSIKTIAEKVESSEGSAENSGNELAATKIEKELSSSTVDDSTSVIEVEGIEPFRDIIYKGCFLSALMPALVKYQCNIMNLITNSYMKFVFEEKNRLESLYVEHIERNSLDDCLSEMGVHIEYKIACENVLEDLKQAIRKNHAVVLCIDCFYSSIRKDTYQRQHSQHSMLIYGMDEKEQMFLVIEQINNGSKMYNKKQIPYSDVQDAYQGYLDNFAGFEMATSTLFHHEKQPTRKEQPTFFEVVGPEDVDSMKQPSDELVWNNYLSFVKENRKHVLESKNNILAFWKGFSELLQDKEHIFEKSQEIMSVFNQIVNSREVLKYRLEHFLPETNVERIRVANLLAKLEEVRNVFMKMHFMHMYMPDWVKMIDDDINEIITYELEICNDELED